MILTRFQYIAIIPPKKTYQLQRTKHDLAHFIVNDQRELLNIKCTSGSTDDRSVLDEMCSELFGILFGDKGYISKGKAALLLEKYGIKLTTTARKNRKKALSLE